jgi:hypothetical protein
MGKNADILRDFIANIKPVTGFKVVSAFIDDFITDTDKKFQNQIVINPPLLPADNETFDEKAYNADSKLLIEIYSARMITAVETYDIVYDKLTQNKDNFLVSIQSIGEGTPSTIIEGATSIKVLTIPVVFDYRYTNP